jgi:O-succinylbenzoic acid--CoA ligase
MARAYDSHMNPALIVDGAAVSFAEVHEKAAITARQLAGLGVGAGDRVAAQLPPGLDFVALLHAMPLLGSVLVPLNTREPSRPALGDALVVEEPLTGPEADVPFRSEVDPDATWVILHTSGTTAAPKPVKLTYGNFRASAVAAASNLPVGTGDRWLCVLPLFHVGGLSILTRSAIHGSCAIVHERFEAGAVRDSLESGEATLVSIVATMLRRLRAAGLERAPALRAALVGGGPVPRDLLEWGADAGLPLLQTYGMTETCSQIATAAAGSSSARPLPGVELRIGEDGEILVRGPMVSAGALASDGWLHTGDRGRLDGGFLHVEGRIKDTIVTGGENVAAAEVEEALAAHPAVADAAVVGRPDPEWGEAVTAFVVVDGDATDAEIVAHCRERLAGYKVPRAIVRVDELPRNASGKLLKGRLTAKGDER